MSIKEIYQKSIPKLQKELGVKNIMAVPKITKVIVSTGVGRYKDPKRIDLIRDRLSKITGQLPAGRTAKKSIASFKLRQGDAAGLVVTLRGARMWDFLDRLINMAIPRMRDFRGLNPHSIDEIGNLTFGIKEHTAFPETSDEDLRDLFGFAVTVVTSARDRSAAATLLRTIGFPFKKK